MSTDIRLNYQKSKNQVEELRDIVKKLRNVADIQLKGRMDSLNKYWDGEASELYIAKGNKLVKKIQKTADSLEETANVMLEVAKAIKEAETTNIGIARINSK